MRQHYFVGDIIETIGFKKNAKGIITATKKVMKQLNEDGEFIEHGHIFDLDFFQNFWINSEYDAENEKVYIYNHQTNETDAYAIFEVHYTIEFSTEFSTRDHFFQNIGTLKDGEFNKIGNLFENPNVLEFNRIEKMKNFFNSIKLRLFPPDTFAKALEILPERMMIIHENSLKTKYFYEMYVERNDD